MLSAIFVGNRIPQFTIEAISTPNLQTIMYKKYVPFILNYCIIYPKLIKVGKDMSDLSLLKIAILIYFF